MVYTQIDQIYGVLIDVHEALDLCLDGVLRSLQQHGVTLPFTKEQIKANNYVNLLQFITDEEVGDEIYEIDNALWEMYPHRVFSWRCCSPINDRDKGYENRKYVLGSPVGVYESNFNKVITTLDKFSPQIPQISEDIKKTTREFEKKFSRESKIYLIPNDCDFCS